MNDNNCTILFARLSLRAPAFCAVLIVAAAASASAAATETVLYSFTGGADGNSLYSGLIADSAGNLYGTTPYPAWRLWGERLQ